MTTTPPIDTASARAVDHLARRRAVDADTLAADVVTLAEAVRLLQGMVASMGRAMSQSERLARQLAADISSNHLHAAVESASKLFDATMNAKGGQL